MAKYYGYEWGQEVTVTGKLVREYPAWKTVKGGLKARDEQVVKTHGGDPRVWERVAMLPRVGILVGFRYLQDGVVKPGYIHPAGFDGMEPEYVESYWEAKDTFRAALVALSPWTNPVYVALGDLL
jgi:hypothetical protein